MKRLTKDIFYVATKERNTKVVQLWHTCAARKNFRIELTNMGTSSHGNLMFKCPYCSFNYNLDPHLDLYYRKGGVRR